MTDGLPVEQKMSQTIRIDIPPSQSGAAAAGQKTTAPASRRPERPPRREIGRGPMNADFRELFQSVYDGAVITDMDGWIQDANVRAVEFLQSDRAELIRMNMVDLISGADDTLISKIRENLEADKFTLIQAFCVRKPKALFPAEISVNRVVLSRSPCLCFFVRDVTLRRQQEEMLRTEHNAIQNSAEGIGIADQDGRLRYVNPAALRLWGLESLRGVASRDIRELWTNREAGESMVKAVLEGGLWAGDLVARRADGGEVPIRVSAAPNRDADGEIQGMVLSFVDLTESRRAEDVMRHTERQTAMLASIGAACHHLGQPATVILGGIAMLQKFTRTKDPVVKDLLGTCMSAAESMEKILHGMNETTEYRTVPYPGPAGDDGKKPDRILEIGHQDV